MFHLDTAFAIELLALTAGAALLGWSGYAHVHAKKLVQATAYAVMALAVLTMLCTAYYGLKYTRAGYFNSPMGMKSGMMMHGGDKGGMMGGGMMDGGGKGGGMKRQENSSGPAHSHDH